MFAELAMVEQPLASVITTVYVPTPSQLTSCVVEVNEFGPVHKKLNGATPPVTLLLMLPVEAPFQVMLYPPATVKLLNKLPNVGGSVNVIEFIAVHPFASVTVKLYAPAINPAGFCKADVNPDGPVHA